MSEEQYRAQKAQEMTGSIADQTAWIIDDDGGITAMYDTGMDNETRYAVIAYVLAGDVLSLSAESANLRADLAAAQEQLENEKFERWQEDQQRNILQQEVSELHALNLYDLVGDPDPLRAEMVSTIRERDELRKGLDAARKQTGIAIARAEYDKAGLRADLTAARADAERLAKALQEIIDAARDKWSSAPSIEIVTIAVAALAQHQRGEGQG